LLGGPATFAHDNATLNINIYNNNNNNNAVKSMQAFTSYAHE